MVNVLVVACFLMTGCGYRSSFSDCTISCNEATGCPNGLACGPEGLCRSESVSPCTDAQVVVLGDADPNSDAPPPPDGMTAVTLVQATSNTPVIGDSPFCAVPANETKTNRWWRVFQPSEHGITGDVLHVTSVQFASESAKAATLTIKLATYTGQFDDVLLDTSKLVTLAQVTGIADGESPQSWSAPITADVPVGSLLAVEIASQDRRSAAGGFLEKFHIGANQAGQSRRSYHGGSCKQPQGVSSHIIISVQATF